MFLLLFYYFITLILGLSIGFANFFLQIFTISRNACFAFLFLGFGACNLIVPQARVKGHCPLRRAEAEPLRKKAPQKQTIVCANVPLDLVFLSLLFETNFRSVSRLGVRDVVPYGCGQSPRKGSPQLKQTIVCVLYMPTASIPKV